MVAVLPAVKQVPLSPGSRAWDAALQKTVQCLRDRHPPMLPSSRPTAACQAGAIHQLWYNQHRVSLGRSIYGAIELLKGLQEMNVVWPAHYPRFNAPTPLRPTHYRNLPRFGQASVRLLYRGRLSQPRRSPPPLRPFAAVLDLARAAHRGRVKQRRRESRKPLSLAWSPPRSHRSFPS